MALTLDEVEDAIRKVMANQSYTIGDVTYTRANLEGLRLMRRDLRIEADQSSLDSGGDIFDRAISVTPRRP